MSVQFTDTNSPTQLQGKFFSPAQIMLGTVLGGVASGTYFMAKNYEAIGDIKKRNMTYFLGLFFIIVAISIVLFFNLNLSGNALSVGVAAGLSAYTRTVLQENQITILGKFLPAIEDQSIRNSNWNVLGAIIGGIVVSVILGLTVAYIYTALVGVQIS